MSRRVALFVDGFNLYHSIAQAARESGDPSIKWLDLVRLGQTHLQEIGGGSELVAVHHFTALPLHLHLTDPQRLRRHQTYLRALRASGPPKPIIHLGRIRQQWVRIDHQCSASEGKVWREKGTDIALAMTLMHEAHEGNLDEAIIVSGDSDFLPFVTTFLKMHPGIRLRFAFPRGRTSEELAKAAPESFTLTTATYLSCKLPLSLPLPSGKHVYCPAEWLR